MDTIANYTLLKDHALEFGAVAFGVCDVREEKKGFALAPEILEGLDYAVAFAVGLSPKILADIVDHPTRLYFHHYKQANALIDSIAMRLTALIQKEGFSALPIPASQIVDWEKQTGHLSHKHIAQKAGIGWIGRSNIIVNRKQGAYIRLGTILTDMPLSVDTASAFGCGECRACIAPCPAGAIKESPADFDHQGCFEKLKYFQKQRYVDQFICGICVKACRGKKGEAF
ncbi:MAG: hypothetical protein WCG78_05350 [Candidatus Omnitrophota bacterium]